VPIPPAIPQLVPLNLKKGSGTFEPAPTHEEPPEKESLFSGGTLYGSLLMGVGFAWFFIGFMADRILIYPAVLFAVGLGTFVKGWIDDR
jgi:hypothetical protein